MGVFVPSAPIFRVDLNEKSHEMVVERIGRVEELKGDMRVWRRMWRAVAGEAEEQSFVSHEILSQSYRSPYSRHELLPRCG